MAGKDGKKVVLHLLPPGHVGSREDLGASPTPSPELMRSASPIQMRRDLKWVFAAPAIHLLVDVDPTPDKLERTEKLLFAGMTRATVRLELVVKEGNPLSERFLPSGPTR